MISVRLCALVSLGLLFGISCKNRNDESLDSNERNNIVPALIEFKNAINSRDSNLANRFLPKQTIQNSYIEPNEVINSCRKFLEHLEVSRLKTFDTIATTVIQKESPCLESYAIIVTADSITFEYKMDKNPDYQITEEDSEEEFDQSSLCEHITWYNFKLFHGQLKLTSLGGAD